MITAISIIVACIAAVFILPGPLLRDRILGMFRSPQDDVQKSLNLLEKNPSNVEALIVLALKNFNEKNYRESYNYYSRLIVETNNTSAAHLHVNRYLIYLNFGICAYHLGETSEALSSLLKAKLLVNDMHTFELFSHIGLIYFEKADYEEAIVALRLAHEQDPKHVQTLHQLAISYYKLTQYEQARPLFAELDDPAKLSETTFYLAICMVRQGELEQAIPRLEAVRALPEFQVKACFELGKIYVEQNESEKALEICQSIIESASNSEVNPKHLCFAYYHSVKLLGKQGLLEEANLMLNQLLQLDSNYENVAFLKKRYAESRDSPQLFKLLEGNESVRRELVKKLVFQLIPHASEVEIVEQHSLTIIAVAHCPNRNRYYVWICLQDEEVTMRQVFHAHVNSKQFNCSHCIMVCISRFDTETISYIEGRPIRLVDSAELKKSLNQIEN